VARRSLKNKIPVNDYMTIHPALDFWLGGAIVAVGAKWQATYTDGSVEFITKPLCILNDGERFEYSKKELANRRLYHTGYLDIPAARWSFDDIEKFGQKQSSPSILKVCEQIKESIHYYMDFMDERHFDLLACFIIYTYFYPLFNGAPILQFWGEFQTGKTKICSLLEAMCFNPINSANISSSSVFRLVESRRATVLLDESEDVSTSERTKEIRNMLLAGTGKSGETFRQEKMLDDSFQTRSFKVFSPKVIANITGIDIPALQSRIIRLVTTGTSNKEKRSREVEQEDERWQSIRNHLYRICLARSEQVLEARYHLPEHSLNGRTLLIWQGILSVASLCSVKIWQSIVSYADENKEYIDAEIEEDASRPKMLIKCLLELTNGNEEVNYFTPDEMLNYMKNRVEFSSKRDLGLMLGRLGLHNRILRRNNSEGRYYEISPARLKAIYESR